MLPRRAAYRGSVWRWTEPRVEKKSIHPTPLRIVLQALIPAAVGAFLWLKFSKPIAATILFGISSLLLVSGFAMPKVFAAIERGVGAAARGFGTALTWILLAPFFYLFFMPARLVLRCAARIRCIGSSRRTRPTYWFEHKAAGPEHYKKQY